MLKNISQLEAIIEAKSVKLLADMDTDINIVESALKQFQGYIEQIKAAHQAQQQESKPAEVQPQEEIANDQ